MKLKAWHWILLAAAFVAGALSPFASSFPDGLEHVAQTLGFAQRAQEAPLIKAPLPDYALPFAPNSRLSTSAAGLVGVAVMFALVYALGKILSRRSDAHDA